MTDRLLSGVFSSPFGPGYFIFRGDAVLRVFLPGTVVPDIQSGMGTPFSKCLSRELSGVFQGREHRIPMAGLCLRDISPFRRAVLLAAVQIPPGRTATYAETAEAAGFSGSARAAGTALARNPLPLLIPCHRVVGSRGSGGYQGGREMKLFLLEKERGTCQIPRDCLLYPP